MRALALAALLAAAISAHASDWTNGDTAREAGFIALDAVDWAQTRWIATHPAWHENNPMMGKHPHLGAVDVFFTLGIVAHPLISYALPHGLYRSAWQYGGIAIECFVIGGNVSAGIRMRF